jgi:hypothetical protein
MFTSLAPLFSTFFAAFLSTLLTAIFSTLLVPFFATFYSSFLAFMLIELLLRMHECPWMLAQVFADLRMTVQKVPEFGMLRDEIRVIRERRIFAELSIKSRVLIEKLVKRFHFGSGDVFAALLKSAFTIHEVLGILSNLFADARM